MKLKISTKGRYGLEALVDLAIHSSEGCVNLKSIAERCGRSEAYILQIFLILRRSGFVESVRGAQGGYVLARNSSQIAVGDVLTALEGPLAPVVCITHTKEPICERHGRCETLGFWESVMNTLNNVVNSITIEDLVQCYQNNKAIEDNKIEYYI